MLLEFSDEAYLSGCESGKKITSEMNPCGL